MTQAPSTARRNARILRIIAAIDTGVGVVGMLAGLIVFVAPPPSFIQAVTIPWLVIVWGVLLLLGGASIIVGRVAGFWLPETAGIVAVATGAVIYCLTLGTAAITKHELGTGVAIGVFVIAIALMGRRYAQLQILTSEQHLSGSFWQRLWSTVTRRSFDAGMHQH